LLFPGSVPHRFDQVSSGSNRGPFPPFLHSLIRLSQLPSLRQSRIAFARGKYPRIVKLQHLVDEMTSECERTLMSMRVLLHHFHPGTHENEIFADITPYRALCRREVSDESDEISSQIRRRKSHRVRVDESYKWTTRPYASWEEIGAIINHVCIGFPQLGTENRSLSVRYSANFNLSRTFLDGLGGWNRDELKEVRDLCWWFSEKSE
jgi:hypothetical protein